MSIAEGIGHKIHKSSDAVSDPPVRAVYNRRFRLLSVIVSAMLLTVQINYDLAFKLHVVYTGCVRGQFHAFLLNKKIGLIDPGSKST